MAHPPARRQQHYTQGVTHGVLDAATLGTCAAYLTAVGGRSRRVPLAQLRTGCHVGAEDTGCWENVPRKQRLCNHCGVGVEKQSGT